MSVLFTRICLPTESFCHMDNTNIYHQINFCENNGAALALEIQKELRRCFFFKKDELDIHYGSTLSPKLNRI